MVCSSTCIVWVFMITNFLSIISVDRFDVSKLVKSKVLGSELHASTKLNMLNSCQILHIVFMSSFAVFVALSLIFFLNFQYFLFCFFFFSFPFSVKYLFYFSKMSLDIKFSLFFIYLTAEYKCK